MLASVVITLGVVVLCTQWCGVAAARTIPTPIASEAERMGTDKVSQLLLEFERWRDPSVAARRHLLQQRPTQWPGWLGFIGQPDGDEEAVSHKCFITKTRVVNKGDSLLVEAFVPADVASSSQALLATVHWRVNWGEEKSMTMEEQGDQNNQRAFAATLPAAAVTQTGSMVRWRVGVREFPSQRLLCGTSREFPRVYAGGTVVDGMASPTQLPVLHWFVKDPGAATKDEDTPCSVYFRGEFYDDVNTHRRGAGRRENQQNAYGAVMTKDWDKHKFKLDFNGEVFSFADDQPRVEEINLQSHYIEPGTGTTYLRENLALKLFQVGLRENGNGWQAQKIGVPASSAVHIRLHQNGVFYGLYSLIEQVDDTFLRRYGLDADGGLWKAVHWKYSNLRAPDSSANCPFATPDYNRDARECPEIFRKAEGVDDTYDPLYTFAQGLNGQPDDEARLRFLLHNTDIAAVVNEMAGQALILHQDRCTKNYYLHRDAVSGLWRRIPWDVEAAFGQDPQVDGCPKEACYPDAEGAYGYCMLTCPKFTTPLFCSVAFPQDIYEANDAPSTYNHLVDAVVRTSFTREMYLARLRTLTNNFLRTGWLREQAEAMSDRISEDVKADAAIWQTGDHRSALQQLNEMLSERQRQLDSQYSWLVPPTADAQAAGVFVNPERFATSTNGIVEITNRADFAADLSGFVLQKEKWTQHSFPPGTVLPAKSSLYLCATMRCQETLEREQGAPVFAQQLQAPKQLPFQLSALKLQKLP